MSYPALFGEYLIHFAVRLFLSKTFFFEGGGIFIERDLKIPPFRVKVPYTKTVYFHTFTSSAYFILVANNMHTGSAVSKSINSIKVPIKIQCFLPEETEVQ
jgi:hypothetical protein